MSKLFVFLLFATITVLVVEHARAEAEQAQQQQRQQHGRRVKRHNMMGEEERGDMGDYPMGDVDLMQRIFRTPLKRQWCRSGMSYNPVLGTCTLSLAAMRGRGRGYRGV